MVILARLATSYCLPAWPMELPLPLSLANGIACQLEQSYEQRTRTKQLRFANLTNGIYLLSRPIELPGKVSMVLASLTNDTTCPFGQW
jgi:hypothetical protein